MSTPIDKKIRDIQHALLCLEVDHPLAKQDAYLVMENLQMSRTEMIEFLTEHGSKIP